MKAQFIQTQSHKISKKLPDDPPDLSDFD